MAKISVEILGDESSLLRSLRRSQSALGIFGSEAERASRKMRGSVTGLFGDFAKGALATVGAGVGLGGLVEGFKSSIEAAEDLERQMQRTEAIFKESAPTVQAWSKTTATSMGMAQQDSLRAADGFGALFQQFGIATPKAAGMSEQMVKLAADMASFSGKSPEQAINALTRAMSGSFRPIRQFGVYLTQNQVKQEAVTLGLRQSVTAADAAKTAYKNAAETASAADKEQTAATRELSKAQTELTSAQNAAQSAAQAVTHDQEALTTATTDLANAEDRQHTAADNLTTAERTLADAKKASKDAENALTDARKQALDEIQQLKDAATDAGLSEQRASLSLAQAREHLRQVMADSTSTDLDKRDALLSVAEAQQSLHEAQERANSSATASKDANKAGVEGSKTVLDAKKQIVSAHDAERNAVEGVTKAQRALIESQRSVAQAVARVAQAQAQLISDQEKSNAANARYQRAQADLAQAQERASAATAKAKTAEDQLRAAKEKSDRLNRGLTGGLTDQQRVLAIYGLVMKDTANQQGNFARHSGNLTNSSRILRAELKNLQTRIGNELLPDVVKVARAIAKWLSDTHNQQALLNGFKTAINLLKEAIGFLKHAFDLLSGATGGSKNALKLLIAAFVAWKTAQATSKIIDIANTFGTLIGKMTGKGGAVQAAEKAAGAIGKGGKLTTATEEAGTAMEETAGSVGGLATALGPAVLGAGALAAGYALGSLLYQLPFVKQAADDVANSIANLFGYTNPMDKYKSARGNVAYQGSAMIDVAKQLIRAGESGAQVTADLARRFPGLSTADYQNYVQAAAASMSQRPQEVHITFHGVTDINKINALIRETLARENRQRPHVR